MYYNILMMILYFLHEAICCSCDFTDSQLTPPDEKVKTLTLVGAVCVGLVTVVPAVIIPVAGPVVRDAAAAVTLKLST